MALLLKLGGIDVKKPTKFLISKYTVTAHMGRVASGLMTGDYVVQKKTFHFEYEAIRGDHLNTILNIIYTPVLFFGITYSENGVTRSATVYAGHIPQELYRSDGLWTWINVNFDLIEQ